jgi:L-lactate dehydrogenase (cytochrome)
LVERALAAGFSTLVVTLDTQIPGRRERDVRNGFEGVTRPTTRNLMRFGPQFARKPRWLIDFARHGFRLEAVNVRRLGEGGGPMPVEEALLGMATFPPTWDDVAWLCAQWPGPVIAKGVIGGDDARRAVDCGVAAIVVSNHGGRQLDGMAATLPAMVEVLEAVGDQVEVLVDGGVRRGSDVARAVALGARAVMVGRAWAYALAAGGQEGVGRILDTFRIDLDRTMRLLGCPSVTALDRSYLRMPAGWGPKEDG